MKVSRQKISRQFKSNCELPEPMWEHFDVIGARPEIFKVKGMNLPVIRVDCRKNTIQDGKTYLVALVVDEDSVPGDMNIDIEIIKILEQEQVLEPHKEATKKSTAKKAVKKATTQTKPTKCRARKAKS